MENTNKIQDRLNNELGLTHYVANKKKITATIVLKHVQSEQSNLKSKSAEYIKLMVDKQNN